MSVPKTIADDLSKLQTDLDTEFGKVLPIIPDPPVDSVGPPFGVPMTLMTIFGLNWDGTTFDPEDNGKGAWGANTRDPKVIGCALPIALVKATFGGLEAEHIKGYTVEAYSQVTQKTVSLIDIDDLGPAARVHRLIDGTFGFHVALGHIDYGRKTWGTDYAKWPAGFHVAFWIWDPKGNAIEIKGVDFAGGRVLGS